MASILSRPQCVNMEFNKVNTQNSDAGAEGSPTLREFIPLVLSAHDQSTFHNIHHYFSGKLSTIWYYTNGLNLLMLQLE